jgi:hypothetical protein
MTATTSTRLRRFVRATLVGATVALGAATLAYPATASAAYDSFKFTNCLEDHKELPNRDRVFEVCCEDAGGYVYKDKDGVLWCYSHDPKYLSRFETSRIPEVQGEPAPQVPPRAVDPYMPTLTTAP